MPRYFKITEIDEETYESITRESLDCSQMSIPVDGDVYVAVDEEAESEISVDLDSFEQEG